MKRIRLGKALARFQRGFALIAVLALAALITAFIIASALSRTSADVANDREDRSMRALMQAKAALIAYAANEQWQLSYTPGTYFQPGALPSPDMDDDGDADNWVPLTSSQLGRFPWKTVGSDELRDASGEHLWYGLSQSFRKIRCTGGTTPPNCTIINSDTQGQLTVVGTAPATQVVAVLFAPGEALQGQNRDPANASAHNNYLNYLEGPPDLSDPLHLNYIFTTAPYNTLPPNPFNDRVVVITQADLMNAVEPVVAANMERDVKQLLVDYYGKWGRYPYAVPFMAPPAAQSAYVGASPQTSGLLPVSTSATLGWQNPTLTQIPPGMGSSTVTSSSCWISSNTVNCTLSYTGGPVDRPDIQIDVFLSGADSAFSDIPSATPVLPGNLSMLDGHGGIPGYNGPVFGYWSPYPLGDSLTPTWSYVGSALRYTGRMQNGQDMFNGATITFTLPPPPGYLPRLTNNNATNPNIDWFISNQWYRQTYYAVSAGFIPSGVGSCNPPTSSSPACLTVNNLATPTNNKQAILILAGRALDGQTRSGPSGGIIANYLEGQNATPADLIFEHRAGVPTSINDRVIVVGTSP
jgi:hypothetical protein